MGLGIDGEWWINDTLVIDEWVFGRKNERLA